MQQHVQADDVTTGGLHGLGQRRGPRLINRVKEDRDRRERRGVVDRRVRGMVLTRTSAPATVAPRSGSVRSRKSEAIPTARLSATSRSRLLRAPGDDGGLQNAEFGKPHHRRRRRPARPQHDCTADVPCPSTGNTVDIGVVGAPPFRVRTRVFADPTSSARSVRSSAHCNAANLTGHRHRQAHPLGAQTAHQSGHLSARTRCGHTSNRTAPERGTPPDAAAAIWSAQRQAQDRGLACSHYRASRAHRCGVPVRCSPDVPDTRA